MEGGWQRLLWCNRRADANSFYRSTFRKAIGGVSLLLSLLTHRYICMLILLLLPLALPLHIYICIYITVHYEYMNYMLILLLLPLPLLLHYYKGLLLFFMNTCAPYGDTTIHAITFTITLIYITVTGCWCYNCNFKNELLCDNDVYFRFLIIYFYWLIWSILIRVYINTIFKVLLFSKFVKNYNTFFYFLLAFLFFSTILSYLHQLVHVGAQSH